MVVLFKMVWRYAKIKVLQTSVWTFLNGIRGNLVCICMSTLTFVFDMTCRCEVGIIEHCQTVINKIFQPSVVCYLQGKNIELLLFTSWIKPDFFCKFKYPLSNFCQSNLIERSFDFFSKQWTSQETKCKMLKKIVLSSKSQIQLLLVLFPHNI